MRVIMAHAFYKQSGFHWVVAYAEEASVQMLWLGINRVVPCNKLRHHCFLVFLAGLVYGHPICLLQLLGILFVFSKVIAPIDCYSFPGCSNWSTILMNFWCCAINTSPSSSSFMVFLHHKALSLSDTRVSFPGWFAAEAIQSPISWLK